MGMFKDTDTLFTCKSSEVKGHKMENDKPFYDVVSFFQDNKKKDPEKKHTLD